MKSDVYTPAPDTVGTLLLAEFVGTDVHTMTHYSKRWHLANLNWSGKHGSGFAAEWPYREMTVAAALFDYTQVSGEMNGFARKLLADRIREVRRGTRRVTVSLSPTVEVTVKLRWPTDADINPTHTGEPT